MRPSLKPFFFLIIILLTVWFQVSFVSVWPIIGTLLNVVVLAVLGTALFWSWNGAAILALIAGVVLGQYAAWTYTYIIALVGTVYGTRLIVQRWIATRSSASLVTAAAVATVIFYLLTAGSMTLAHSLNYSLIGADWTSLWPVVLWQSVLHPIILYLVWRRYSGGTYARTLSTQPF